MERGISEADYKILSGESFDLIYYIPGNKLYNVEKNQTKRFQELLASFSAHEMTEEAEAEFKRFCDSLFAEKPYYGGDNYEEGLPSLKKLRRLEILLCNTCNLKCRYCYATEGTYGQEEMIYDGQRLREDLEQLFPETFASVEEVFFFGGEPLINFDGVKVACDFFHELVEKGYMEKDPIFTMVTNATLIDEERAEFLADHEVRITVSLDGPDYINDLLRVRKSGQGTYSLVDKNIKTLQEKGAILSAIEATYTKKHQELGLSRKDIGDYLSTRYDGAKVMVENCSGGELGLQGTQRGLETITQRDYLRAYSLLHESTRRETYCFVGFDRFMITPDGISYPCHFFMLDKKYGFTDRNTYQKSWSALVSVDRKHRSSCQKCWAQNLCQVCVASLLVFRNEEGEAAFCDANRTKLEKLLVMIAEDAFYHNRDHYNALPVFA